MVELVEEKEVVKMSASNPAFGSGLEFAPLSPITLTRAPYASDLLHALRM